jgi:hypothetical protein
MQTPLMPILTIKGVFHISISNEQLLITQQSCLFFGILNVADKFDKSTFPLNISSRELSSIVMPLAI